MDWFRWRGRRAEPLGARGERVAARWLRRRGYRLLARNLRLGDDEADLVMLAPDRRTVVLVEVKTRAREDIRPEDQIGPTKRYRMARLAARLQRRRAYADRPVRLDAVAVVWPQGGPPEVRHYAGAFESPF